MSDPGKKREATRENARYEVSNQVASSRYFFRSDTAIRTESNQLTPIYGGFEECTGDYRILRDSFPFSTIELVVAGRGTLILNGSKWSLRPGSLFAYDRTTHVDIRSDAKDPLVKYFVCLREKQNKQVFSENGLAPGSCKQVLSPFPLQRVIDDLIDEGRSLGPATEAICSRLVELLLLKIDNLPAGDSFSGGIAETTFLRCRGIIEREALRLRSLGEIVTRVGVESAHLCRLFRRFQGQSPYQYLNHQKMTTAAERIVRTSCLVKEAAEFVGMNDVYHFSRLFKKTLHVSPVEFRRAMHRG